MSEGYEILSLDDLGRYPQDDALLLPLRHHLGLRAFGANAWTAAVGDHVVPRHLEDSGDEELYVVVRGTARFTVGDETFAAPAGTLVHVPPQTLREAIAEEPDTIVLAVGATVGQPFQARGWDEVRIAFGEALAGNLVQGRAVLEDLMTRHPDAWEGWYNLACFESLFGDRELAFDHLAKAMALDEQAGTYAQGDDDLVPLHADDRWKALFE